MAEEKLACKLVKNLEASQMVSNWGTRQLLPYTPSKILVNKPVPNDL